MATPDWLNGPGQLERLVGQGHPLYVNTKDRCGQTIQAMLEVEHTTDGSHLARLTGLVGEIDTFTGNGAARMIALSNSGLTPKKILVWEAPGSELLTNGGFDADTTGWTAHNYGNGAPTIASVAGGISGNCCQMTSNTALDPQGFYQAISGLVIGESYRLTFWLKQGTAAPTVNMIWGTAIGSGSTETYIAPAAWTQYTNIRQATATTMYLTCQTPTGGLTPGNTTLFDEISVVRAGHDVTRIDEMASGKAQPLRYKTFAWEADLLDNEQAGSFDVGDVGINTNGETNYYLVLGIDTDTVPIGDTGAGSDPDWITSSVLNRIIADNTGNLSLDNIANYVESQIWTQFIEEHGVDGSHSITLQHARIETITWAGDNTDDRAISCAITDLDILSIEVYRDGMPVASKTSDMAGDTTKDEDAAAFAANMIQDITTNGEFEVGTALNASGSTYVAILIGV